MSFGAFSTNNQQQQNGNKQEKKKNEIMISLSDMAGSKFVDLYYTAIDYNRDLLVKFYRGHSKVTWNGQDIQMNEQTFPMFYKKLQQSRHQLITVNIQPILHNASETPTVMVTVNGKVSYLGSKAVPFTQTFVLSVETQNINSNNGQQSKKCYYIASDIFRLQGNVSK